MGGELLPEVEVDQALLVIGGWTRVGAELRRELCFGDFSSAFGFLTRVALVAEQLDHHPEIRNVYRDVELRISTHSAGGLTLKDLEFARKVEGLLSEGG